MWYNTDMLSTILIFCSLAFAETKTLAVQICLDRAGYSCNAIDGQWGRKSQSALEKYCAARGVAVPPTPESAYDRLFADADRLFRIETVAAADLSALVDMPRAPAEKAKLAHMGYASIPEMFAERGHLTRRAFERLNPGVDWTNVQAGLRLVIPDFPSVREELSVWPKDRPRAPQRPEAARVCISLSKFEITVYDKANRLIALFPCSIAKNKAKLPSRRELRIVTQIANPNYTYTSDRPARGGKTSRHIFPPGPRCPVGVAWLGLDLPGYGIHGTPYPETVGRPESHGCFRLANWNAARLYALCPVGTPVTVTP